MVSGDRLETTTGAVITSPSRHRTPVTLAVVDEDLLDLGAVADLAAAALEHLAQVLGEGADAALEFGHHRGALFGDGQGEGQAGGAAGRVGPAVGGVDGEEGEHAAHDGVLLLVRQVAVDDVHGRAE